MAKRLAARRPACCLNATRLCREEAEEAEEEAEQAEEEDGLRNKSLEEF